MTDTAGGTAPNQGAFAGNSMAAAEAATKVGEQPPSSPEPREENPRTRGHSPSRDHREAAAATEGAEIERKIPLDGVEHPESRLRELLARDAEAQVRKQSLPQDAAGYEVKFNDDFVQPVGTKFEFCEAEAGQRYGLGALRDFAVRKGLDQHEFGELLQIHAASQFEGVAAQKRFIEGETKALGAQAPARVSAVHQFLNGAVGEKSAAALMAGLVTARQVEAFESIINQFSRQGSSQMNGGGRDLDLNPPGKIPGYENMSFVERRGAQVEQQFGTKKTGSRR